MPTQTYVGTSLPDYLRVNAIAVSLLAFCNATFTPGQMWDGTNYTIALCIMWATGQRFGPNVTPDIFNTQHPIDPQCYPEPSWLASLLPAMALYAMQHYADVVTAVNR